MECRKSTACQAKVLTAYQRSQLFAHPLSLYKDDLLGEVNLLSEIYMELHRSEVKSSVSLPENKAKIPREYVSILKQHRLLAALNRFQRTVHQQGVSLLREPSLRQMKQSLEGLEPMLNLKRSLWVRGVLRRGFRRSSLT